MVASLGWLGSPVALGAESGELTTLTQAVDKACKQVGDATKSLKLPSPWPCGAPPLAGDAASTCRAELIDSVGRAFADSLESAASVNTADIISKWEKEGRAIEALQIVSRLHRDLDAVGMDATGRLRERARERFSQLDLTVTEAEANAKTVWTELVGSAATDFTNRCRGELVPLVFNALAIQSLREGAETAHNRDLTKTDGFSPIVRCEWVRATGRMDRLDCKPGLRLSGQDASSILIQPPTGEPEFRIAWVQATTAEEGFRPPSAQSLTCPRYPGGDARKLACDELCFARPGGDSELCADASYRSVPLQSTSIVVHMPRRVKTTYGCRTNSDRCAFERLRGAASASAGSVQREKLSLLLRGKTPFILVHALDAQGRLASGTILVGYERWRVETGGFLAVSPLVDHELVQAVPDAEGEVEIGGTLQPVGAGQVAVLRPRNVDERSQETGIFVNFIPRNYETWGLGFGLATHDGEAPSIYFGPVLRLRSFGHQGLAAFTGGVVMRQVDRFPDFEPGVYDADSSFLQPSSRFDHDWFVGIQLGFSFGSISVPGVKGD